MQNVIQRLNERRVKRYAYGRTRRNAECIKDEKRKTGRRKKKEIKQDKVRSPCRGSKVMDKLWLGKTSRDVITARIVPWFSAGLGGKQPQSLLNSSRVRDETLKSNFWFPLKPILFFSVVWTA